MNDDIKQDRSPASPKISLEGALELTRILYEKIGKSVVKREVAVVPIGYKSINGASLTVLGALRAYGLIERSKAGVSVSPLAVRVIHPTDEAQRLAGKQEAALKPKVFAELFSGGYGAMTEDILCNHLIQSGFTPDGAKIAASVFKENILFAKLDNPSMLTTKNDGQALGANENEPAEDDHQKPLFQQKHVVDSLKKAALPGTLLGDFLNPQSASVVREFTFPLSSGMAALKVPYPMNEDDFQLFIGTLNLWKKKLVRAFTAIEPPVKFPANATWKNNDHDKPVKIVAVMGEQDGELYYRSEDGTGIPASQLTF